MYGWNISYWSCIFAWLMQVFHLSCELIDDLECHLWMARMNAIISNKLSKEIEDIPSSPFNMQT